MQNECVDLNAIERRIHAITAVSKVVHAIWALSRAELPLVEEAVEQATQYLHWIDEMVEAVAGKPRRVPSREVLVVVIGPERPYCGALPRQIIEQLLSQLERADVSLPHAKSPYRVGIVGARLAEAALQEPRLADRIALTIAAGTTHEEHEDVARNAAAAILEHARNADVELYYPSGGTSTLAHATLLASAREPVAYPPETFSSLSVVLRATVSASITGRLAIGVVEALRSEVRARIAAADAARHAADEKLALLRKDWGLARQEQITSELLEMIAGRQATITRKNS